MKRKTFIRNIALATVAAPALLSQSCKSESSGGQAEGSSTSNSKKYKWKMVTTWPPNFPILGEGSVMIADWIREMSDGRLDIRVYGGGELVPPLETFDAVSGGVADMGSGAGYYWAGKAPAAQFFASVPFGMNAQQMNAWLISGGGLELWEELYSQYNLIPMPGGNTGIQMAGWFNREIRTIDDFKGLKMRIPGLGGKVLEKAGGTAVLSAGSEIYTNLERGVIDATEWVGPFHDYKMGFHKIAKYYYYPGWHEPGSTLEIIVNKQTFESLPVDLQQIVRTAVARLSTWTLSEFETQNAIYLEKLRNESSCEIRPLPDEVLRQLKIYTEQAIDEITSTDPFSKRVYESYTAFRANARIWAEMTEKAYYQSIG